MNMQKITRIVMTLALPAIVIGSAFAAPPVNMKSGRFVTPREKNAQKAFRMQEGYKGDAAAKQLAEKLFRTKGRAEVVNLKDDGSNHMLHVSKDDPSAHFRIDKTTGDFSWSKGFKGYENDGTTPGLPGKDAAVDIAKRHLTELGIMPADQKQLVVHHVGGVKQQDLGQDGKPTAEHDKLVTVFFGRQIDGVEVGGPGSKITVDLGANGELVSVNKRWMELNEEKKNDGDFSSQAEVNNKIKAKLTRDGSNAKSIDSSEAQFGYFDDGKGNIEPAYFYTADVVYDIADDKGQVVKTIHEKQHGAVPALKGSHADFDQLEKAKGQPTKSVPRNEDKPSQKDS